MEEKDVDLWCDAVHDIIKKDIGKVYRMYEMKSSMYIKCFKWKRSYHHFV